MAFLDAIDTPFTAPFVRPAQAALETPEYQRREAKNQAAINIANYQKSLHDAKSMYAAEEAANEAAWLRNQVKLGELELAQGTTRHETGEISLFDSDGQPVAYIDTAEDMTIYLWGGQPVAYLKSGMDSLSVFGFNGSHLGWLQDGLVIDHDGYVCGFIRGAVAKQTAIEPLKGLKRICPIRRITEIEPIQPITKMRFSNMPLAIFLQSGRD